MSPRAIEFPATGLTDGDIVLRLPADADIGQLVVAAQDPEIVAHTRVPAAYGERDARQWLRSAELGAGAGTDLPLVIVDAERGDVLGTTALHGIDPAHGRCSAGYWVAAPARGRGIASRALRMLCEFAFAELDIARVELWIEPANLPSQRVAAAAGFTREGLLRSYVLMGDRRQDMLMYSLLRAEAQATRSGAEPGPNRTP